MFNFMNCGRVVRCFDGLSYADETLVEIIFNLLRLGGSEVLAILIANHSN